MKQGIELVFEEMPRLELPIRMMAQALLVDDVPSGLSRIDRESAFVYQSIMNDCSYCEKSHQAVIEQLKKQEDAIGTDKDYQRIFEMFFYHENQQKALRMLFGHSLSVEEHTRACNDLNAIELFADMVNKLVIWYEDPDHEPSDKHFIKSAKRIAKYGYIGKEVK